MKRKGPELVGVTQTSRRTQPERRDSRAVGRVCSWTEKIRIKSLETAGVVRDNAVIVQVKLTQIQMSGNATNRELRGDTPIPYRTPAGIANERCELARSSIKLCQLLQL